MIGMVLAAGAGRRLHPLTDALPKTLLEIDDGTTILDVALGNLASVGLDSCVCTACSARWDEDAASGEFRGRDRSSSVLAPRDS